jgi:HlyD family secretion protein
MKIKYPKTVKFILLSSLVVALSVLSSFNGQDETLKLQPLQSAPVSPFKSSIFGVGIVEPSTNNISIGSSLSRIVEKILVHVGAKVQKGQILIELDNRDLIALLDKERIDLKKSHIELKKLESMPTHEDLTIAKLEMQTAELELSFAKKEAENVAGLERIKSVNLEDIERRHYELSKKITKFEESRTRYEKIKKGAKIEDIELAKLNIQENEALIEKTKSDIENSIIRAPIDGKVLQIKIQEGELMPLDTYKNPIMLIGDTDSLNLRVNINQYDAPYFNQKATAVAFLQGDANSKYNLEFVQIEPYLVSKTNLSSDVTEKVDTRVLQVIYRIKDPDKKIFVEEQLDVFIEANFPDVQNE